MNGADVCVRNRIIVGVGTHLAPAPDEILTIKAGGLVLRSSMVETHLP